MSAEGHSRQDLAFAAFTRIEIKLDHVIGVLRTAGFAAEATEQDARSQYGDAKIAMQMRSWPGQQYKGGRASECPPAFLLAYADMLEGMALRTMSKPAEQNDPEKLKYARYNMRDAALCRAWAAINRDKPVGEAASAPPATSWDEGPPAARPTPHSAGNAVPADPWEESNDGSGW